jgi:hypothetical protein
LQYSPRFCGKIRWHGEDSLLQIQTMAPSQGNMSEGALIL